MTKPLNIEFEKAVRFLATHLPPSDENSRKPVLFHDIRVGIYLYENGYAPDVVLAGILHDTLEWSDADEQMLRENFGDNVTAMVSACTKNNSIADREERNIEMIKHCIQIGEDALIVKAADIIDSFKWYSSQDNNEQLQFHCLKNANAISKLKLDDFNDKIFDELKSWQVKFAHLAI